MSCLISVLLFLFNNRFNFSKPKIIRKNFPLKSLIYICFFIIHNNVNSLSYPLSVEQSISLSVLFVDIERREKSWTFTNLDCRKKGVDRIVTIINNISQ